MNFKGAKLVTGAVILSGGLLFLYVLLKAYSSSFTHDESFSFLYYTPQTFMEIISFSDWYTNNHILNSLLMKYSALLFGTSELALRLPNLLLLGVYMTYCFLLFRKKHPLLLLPVFLLLCSNRLLMDLFGMARGYGLSIGFMLMGLYHFIKFLKGHKKSHLGLFHFSAMLAILSNFTMLLFYAGLLLSYNVVMVLQNRFILKKRVNLFKVNLVHLLPFALVTVVLYEPVRRVIMYSELNFGGKNGFFEDSVQSLITNTFHYSTFPQGIEWTLMGVFALTVVGGLFVILRKAFQGNAAFFDQHKDWMACNFLLVGISLMIVVQHHLLGNDYPIARFSIFLFPLFILNFGFLSAYALSFRFHRTVKIGISGLALLSVFSFGKSANLHSNAEWGYDSHTKDMIVSLEAYQRSNGDLTQPVKLGCNWLFEPTINFYRVTKGFDWLLSSQKEEIKGTEDFCFLYEKDLSQLVGVNYEVIKEYKDKQTLLIKLQKGN